ncbi:tetratricopeptide repeat protein [Cerasicoccus frondis]|uniref:tetratricopeptide repeat protein n=1 Tax=Cerasicoccus frondis TaxID=490090 RepID=UPI002852C781|nr:tetratricopeptide repeat protein [Cerasicoccus frondis]
MSWLPITILVVGAASLCAAGYWYWQHHELTEAQAAMQAQDYEESIRRANLVIDYGWKKDKALELRSLALIKLAPEDALAVINEDRDGAISPRVGMELLRHSKEHGAYEGVEEIYDALGPSQGGEPEYLLLQAQIEFDRDHPKRALESLDRLLTIDPNHSSALLLKGQYLLSQPSPLTSLQAKSILRRAGEAKNEDGFRAMILLGARADIPMFDNDRKWLVANLEKSKRSTPLSRIIIATQHLFLDPEKRPTIIRDTVNREVAESPALVANWLLTIGAYEELLTLMNSSNAELMDSKFRWLGQLKAHLGQGQLEDAIKLINQQGDSLDELHRATMLAHIQSRDAAPSPTEAWLHAYQLAANRGAFEQMLSLASLALRNKWTDASLEAYYQAVKIAQNDSQKSRALNLLFIALVSNSRTQQGLEVILEYLALQPNSHEMWNNAAYLEALLGTPSEQHIQKMSELVEAMPNSIYPSTYAFMLWKQGRVEAASEQLAHLNRRYLAVPSCRLSSALVALDQNDSVTAQEMLHSLKVEQLLPEEQTLFEEAMQKLPKL